MIIRVHLITLFRVINPHQICLQAKVKYRNEPKQVMPKIEEIKPIWIFDTEFPTIFNKSCTYITFKSAVKHRQLSYIFEYITHAFPIRKDIY